MLVLTAHANEPVASREWWKTQGFTEPRHAPHIAFGEKLRDPLWTPHSLAWPVEFEETAHAIGNTMLEFQSYGDGPYFHGGCDLRVKAKALARTPVAGRVEAGHYGYSNNPDGSMTKWWKPWPQPGSASYFEVAVITDDGFRFEFHHMDEKRLSPTVLRILREAIESGNSAARIAAGTILGASIPWGDGVYHHIHYNIVAEDQTRLNPEYYSPLVPDGNAPEVAQVFSVAGSGHVEALGGATGDGVPGPELSKPATRPIAFAVVVKDRSTDGVYDHPPVYAALEYGVDPASVSTSFVWDFTQKLLDSKGAFPKIWDFYIAEIQVPGGQIFHTEGGYARGQSIVKLPVPAEATGPFRIVLKDQSGNTTILRGNH